MKNKADDIMQVGMYYYLGGPRYWEPGPPIPPDRSVVGWQLPDLSRISYPSIVFDNLGLTLLIGERHIFVVWQPPMLVLPPLPGQPTATHTMVTPVDYPPATKRRRRP